jgi:hypothetical protein
LQGISSVKGSIDLASALRLPILKRQNAQSRADGEESFNMTFITPFMPVAARGITLHSLFVARKHIEVIGSYICQITIAVET